MYELPRQNTLIAVIILAVLFFGAARVGLTLAATLAPESQVASVISFLFFPAALILGFNTWLGLAILIVEKFLRRFLRTTVTRNAIDNHVTGMAS